jgi:AbrB family looped-hinge helix DNA binding protein
MAREKRGKMDLRTIILWFYWHIIDGHNVGGKMETVKVSSKYQVVIPKRIREQFRVEPGQELQIYVLDDTIRMHRPRSIKELRGIAKGMRWKDEDRDHTERF